MRRPPDLLTRCRRSLLPRLQKLGAHATWLERHLAATEMLQQLANPRRPLPPMTGWAISPDFGLLIVWAIANHRPRLIVELGPGASTIIAGYGLEQLGRGRLVALEHDEGLARLHRSAVGRHSLRDVVTIKCSRLQRFEHLGEKFRWYSLRSLRDLAPESVDLVIVDGPPGLTGRLSRYPALPALWNLLSGSAVILVDDATREDESEMIGRWLREYPALRGLSVPTNRGAFLLQRRSR